MSPINAELIVTQMILHLGTLVDIPGDKPEAERAIRAELHRRGLRATPDFDERFAMLRCKLVELQS